MDSETLKARADMISWAITKTLSEVLKEFEPDDYLRQHALTDVVLDKYGDRPVMDFVRGPMANINTDHEPDVWNGNMKPFNILVILEIISY